MRFDNKIAIVLGAAGKDNMGQAIARRLSREGAHVIVAGRNQAALESLASEIGGVAAVADATSEADLAALVAIATKRYGALHIGVNATGKNLVKPLLETTVDELHDMADIQFVAPFLFLQAMVRGMADGGAIVHLSSVSARSLLRSHAAYMGTKAGMEQVVRAFAFEFGACGIRINALAPGLTRTPMTQAVFDSPAIPAARAASLPLRRIGTTDDVAAAVAWLCDPECFMTGETLQVNGGGLLLAPALPPLPASIAKR